MTKSHQLVNLLGVICSLCLYITPISAQYSMGGTGLLNIPSAEMQPDGTFMAGVNYLPQEILPDRWDHNTGNYFLNITFLSFMEVAYRCTLIKTEPVNGNKWQQDRSVTVRLRPLKEAIYWPALVVGSNDAFTTNQINVFKDADSNRFFSSVYGVATKHFSYAGEWGLTAGYNIAFRSQVNNEGLFGGISYSPPFLSSGKIIAEYDANAFNVGAAVRLFNHLSVHLFCYDFKALSGGLRYEFHLIK